MSKYYFAEDGSYGWAGNDPLLFDTEGWTLADWEEIENCLDSERAFIARGIGHKYQLANLREMRRLSDELGEYN